MVFIFGKKGISPLIGTVLIIGFTIALAAIIITWGVSFVTQQTVETGEQTQETLELVQSAGVKVNNVVFNDGETTDTFNFTVENTGSIDLEGFLIRAYDEDGNVYTNTTDLSSDRLGPFGVKKFADLGFNNGGTAQDDLSEVTNGDLIPKFRGEYAQFMKVNWRV